MFCKVPPERPGHYNPGPHTVLVEMYWISKAHNYERASISFCLGRVESPTKVAK